MHDLVHPCCSGLWEGDNKHVAAFHLEGVVQQLQLRIGHKAREDNTPSCIARRRSSKSHLTLTVLDGGEDGCNDDDVVFVVRGAVTTCSCCSPMQECVSLVYD